MFTTLFTQANPNTIYGSIFENNMDEASITNWEESLIRTITLPRQAYGGWLLLLARGGRGDCGG